MPDDETAEEPQVVETVPEPEAPPVPVSEPDVDLVGVMITNRTSKALVVGRSSHKERWVGVDERIGEWMVATIGDDHIVLRHEDQTRCLEMHADAKPGQPPAR